MRSGNLQPTDRPADALRASLAGDPERSWAEGTRIALGGDLRLHELRSLDLLHAARAPWTDLVQRVANATPFQTWEWVVGFARYDRSQPRVLVWEHVSGRWVGVLPLCDRGSLLPGIKRLELIGARLSDYPGLLAESAWRAACEHSARAWLARLAQRPIALLRGQFEVPPPWLPALPYRVLAQDAAIVVPLPSDMEQLLRSLTKRFRGNLRREQRLAENARLDFHTPTTEQELRAALPVLFQLHQLRKNSQGERGRFHDARWCEALTEIAIALQLSGVTQLTILRINDEPAAASFDLRLHGTQYTYQYGMNPRLSTFSPGRLLTRRMIEEAIGAGMKRYDFGRGVEDYKLQWSKERRAISDLIMARGATMLSAWTLVHQGHRRLLYSRLLKRAYLAVRGRAAAPEPEPPP